MGYREDWLLQQRTKSGARALDETRAGGQALRVAHLHSTLGVYGAERWTLALLGHVDRSAIEPMVVTIGSKPGADSFHRMLVELGHPAYHLPVPGKLNPKAIGALRRFLVERRIDILHTHGFKADVLGLLACLGLPVRLVSTIHGWSADEGIRIKLYEAISRLALRRFDRVYPLSPALLQSLLERGFEPDRLHMILNGVDLAGFEYRFRRRAKEDPFSIVFVGRICRPKGVFELMHAFAQARFRAPARLSIVGEGPQREELEALAVALGVKDRITFVGAVGSIAPILAQSDVMVLPSYAEGIPRAVMEAFAAGVPVIGSAIPGIQQLIQNEVTGLVVPVREPQALAHALERLCDEPAAAQRMALAAHRLVTERFSAQRMADDYQTEYRRLCCAA